MLSRVLNRLFTVVSVALRLLTPGPSRPWQGSVRVLRPLGAKCEFLMKPTIAAGTNPNPW